MRVWAKLVGVRMPGEASCCWRSQSGAIFCCLLQGGQLWAGVEVVKHTCGP